MHKCVNCPFFSSCRQSPVDLLDFAVRLHVGESPFEIADRVLAALTPHQLERIALETLITLEPATDCRAIAKEEIVAAVEAMDWDTRGSLQ